MNNWSAKFALIVITLWVGALWTTGGMAYVLFDTLNDKQLAGQLAGNFFHYLSYLGMFAAGYLLMLLLVLAGHFGIQPLLAQLKADALPSDVMQSVFSDRFKTWHGVASIAYLIQCLLGFVVVLRAK